ncbi:MAG TPA: hypothetical protein VMV94_18395 [Phycisphaerae bacterium]|nr:hypothetical protein [Phycisphaerae bacterium]
MQEGQTPEEAYETAATTSMAVPLAGGMSKALTLPSGQNPLVDLNLPHYANSPNMRKFVDTLPGLAVNPAAGDPNVNGLGQYIPIAIADTTTYPGSDYYEIAVVDYLQKMNTDLPPTRLRGYVQIETPVIAATGNSKHLAFSAITFATSAPATAFAVERPQYMGPLILAKKDRPVRVKLVNYNPVGAAGNLFIPVDMGVMGAGMGPTAGQNFTQNRALFHLHGGRTPWISDGTPHQWVAPAGEVTPYLRGASTQNVPDMPDPGPGAITYYYTNGQSARLLFYHDHCWGITRLNVYVGEAAPYLITDQVEDDLIDGTDVSGVFAQAGTAPTPILPNQASLGAQYRYGIPLVIQDKSWVNDATTPPGPGFAATGATPTSYTAAVDPLWSTYAPNSPGGYLWWPHEYVVNENIYDPTGITVMGRWDYGPWMNPPMVVNNPVLPSPTITPESFMDSIIVNGTAYPTITLPPEPVRFRILSVGNDRTLNLSLFYAEPISTRVVTRGSGFTGPITVTFSAPPAPGVAATGTATLTQGVSSTFTIANPGSGYTTAPLVTFTRATGDTTGYGAAATATIAGGVVTGITLTDPGVDYTLPPIVTVDPPPAGTTALVTAALTGEVGSITVTSPGSGYTTTPTVLIQDNAGAGPGTGATAVTSLNTEVKMVPASPIPAWPTWPIDGRPGGVPDPATSGPPWILIGNESGFLANVDVIPPQPVDFDYNRKNVTFGGVTSKSLLLNPAIRADVIVDLSSCAGKTLIMYNDCPAPMPLYDVRYDYFTDDPDQTGSGGAPSTPLGFGPNTRTVMQINVTAGTPVPYNLAPLQTVLPKAFKVGQDPIVVPESAFNAAYGTAYPDIFTNVATESLNVTGAPQPVAKVMTMMPGAGYTTPPTVSFASAVGSGAVATAGLNPIGGITLVTAGSGYTTPPAVTIGPPALPLAASPAAFNGLTNGVQATAVATISGGQVTAISVVEPGAGYTNTVTAPTITIAAPTTAGGVTATATVMLPTLNTVGSIVLVNAGSGYLQAPQVFLTGGGGMGAQATAMLNGAMAPTYKNMTEGFDPEYGRMFVQLGSTPNPLTPNVGAGPVIGLAKYIDPPTEFLTPEVPVLWQITHLGVDSHALHFHLFDVQLINRVDWADIVKPPYPEEVGWKDTIRTNPFEDILIALKPTATAMKLPFGIPDSIRLLDPSTVAGSTASFQPIAPPPGVPAVAQITNVMTNFGWEYVFHCHLLGHEENDFMRPMCFQVPSTIPTAPVLTLAGTTGGASLSWTDATPFNYTTGTPTTTLGNPANEVGFKIMRGTGTGGALTQIGTAPANTTTYVDNTARGGTYRYQVVAWNAAGSRTSNTVTARVTVTPPAAPSNLTGTATTVSTRNATVTLTFLNNATNQTGFTIQRSTSAAFTGATTTTINSTVPAGTTVTATQTGVRRGRTWYFRVRAFNGGGTSAWSPTLTLAVP